MTKLLIVEDEKLIRDIIQEYFSAREYEVVQAMNGYEALDKIDQTFDIVLLDIMMPGMDGYEVCKEIRSKYEMPIIFISALSETENQLDAYSLGADDYITKPFKPSLLYAKCQALLKREHKEETKTNTYGHIQIDPALHVMIINGETIALANKEYLLLEFFCKNEGCLLTRQQLLDEVWGYDYYGDGRAIDTYIKKIRKKMGPYAHYIQTVVKVGYMFKTDE